MAVHEQSVGASDEWYTPPQVFMALGVHFDLDVASPTRDCPADAFCNACLCGGSLESDWSGFIWMNPPFGGRNGLTPWLSKFIAHANGVALVPDRTSAPWWQEHSPRADAVLFLAEKLKFLTPDPILGSRKNKDGTRTPSPSADYPGLYVGSQPAQGTTLLAVGPRGVAALQNAAQAGLGSLWLPLFAGEAA